MLLPVFSRQSMDGRRHGELKLTAWSLDIYYTGGLVWWGSPAGCGGVTRRLRRILRGV
jgi:hypothetical protein